MLDLLSCICKSPSSSSDTPRTTTLLTTAFTCADSSGSDFNVRGAEWRYTSSSESVDDEYHHNDEARDDEDGNGENDTKDEGGGVKKVDLDLLLLPYSKREIEDHVVIQARRFEKEEEEEEEEVEENVSFQHHVTKQIRKEEYEHNGDNNNSSSRPRKVKTFIERNREIGMKRREEMARARDRFQPGSSRLFKPRRDHYDKDRDESRDDQSNFNSRATTYNVHSYRVPPPKSISTSTTNNTNKMKFKGQSLKERTQQNMEIAMKRQKALSKARASSARKLNTTVLYSPGPGMPKQKIRLFEKYNRNNNDDDNFSDSSSYVSLSSTQSRFDRLYEMGREKRRASLSFRKLNYDSNIDDESCISSQSLSVSSSHSSLINNAHMVGVKRYHYPSMQRQRQQQSESTMDVNSQRSKRKNHNTSSIRTNKMHRNITELRKRDYEISMRRREDIAKARAASTRIKTLPAWKEQY